MEDQSTKERIARAQRHREAINLHEIEGNPFTSEDETLFEMFDREGFTDEQRVAYIKRSLPLTRQLTPQNERYNLLLSA